jgi:xanthine/uracil permease
MVLGRYMKPFLNSGVVMNLTKIDHFLIWGQILVTCWFQIALSFCPPRYLEKIFPPVVTGPTVILIGVALITSGIEQWGGGTYCATQVRIAITMILLWLQYSDC